MRDPFPGVQRDSGDCAFPFPVSRKKEGPGRASPRGRGLVRCPVAGSLDAASLIRRNSTAMMAITSRMWIRPPRVTEESMPMSQRTTRMTAIV
jgi:hypothetical protein